MLAAYSFKTFFSSPCVTLGEILFRLFSSFYLCLIEFNKNTHQTQYRGLLNQQSWVTATAMITVQTNITHKTLTFSFTHSLLSSFFSFSLTVNRSIRQIKHTHSTSTRKQSLFFVQKHSQPIEIWIKTIVLMKFDKIWIVSMWFSGQKSNNFPLITGNLFQYRNAIDANVLRYTVYARFS